MDGETEAALRDLVELVEGFPGQFSPEFELGYMGGVAHDAERWYVRFEGDIRDNEFTVTAHSAAQALRDAATEARRCIP